MAFKVIIFSIFLAVTNAGVLSSTDSHEAHETSVDAKVVTPVVEVKKPITIKTVVPVATKLDEAEHNDNPQYSYAYNIQDGITGDNKQHQEIRNGDVVEGSYSLVEADGSRRTVHYTADAIHGFNAIVNKETQHATQESGTETSPLKVTKVTPIIAKATPIITKVAPVSSPVVQTKHVTPTVQSGQQVIGLENLIYGGYSDEVVSHSEYPHIYKHYSIPLHSRRVNPTIYNMYNVPVDSGVAKVATQTATVPFYSDYVSFKHNEYPVHPSYNYDFPMYQHSTQQLAYNSYNDPVLSKTEAAPLRYHNYFPHISSVATITSPITYNSNGAPNGSLVKYVPLIHYH